MSASNTTPSGALESESSYPRDEVIAAIQDFYELLIRLPYVEPDALILPPKEGWSGVNVQELERRGKTEEVVELLRHLPYLRSPALGKRWMIGPDTIVIAYCNGEVYEKLLDSIQPIPGHCIWLTDPESRDGTSLLLDTQAGTITEWTTLGHKIMIDYDDYEALPSQDKWMAHATMPAVEFFRTWKRKFDRLIWMALYNPRGAAGTAQWFITAVTRQDEEDMLASDDDFEPNGDGSEAVGEDEDDFPTEDDLGDDCEPISTEEVDGLMEDAYGEEAQQVMTDLLSENENVGPSETDIPNSVPLSQRQLSMGNLDRKTKEVYEIYTRNGWPSRFDRKSCRKELADFLEREVRHGSYP